MRNLLINWCRSGEYLFSTIIQDDNLCPPDLLQAVWGHFEDVPVDAPARPPGHGQKLLHRSKGKR
jgi:hypothetical protein